MSYAPDAWAVAALAVVLVTAAVTDVWKGKILNAVTYPAILIGLAAQTVLGGLDGLQTAAVGFAVGFGPLLVCWLAGGIGGGDAKLMGAVGALTNWRFAVAAMAFSFAVAVLMAIGVMLARRIAWRTLRRIGRAIWLALLPGARAGWPDDTASPKIPFGLAVSVGAALALTDGLLGGPVVRALMGT